MKKKTSYKILPILSLLLAFPMLGFAQGNLENDPAFLHIDKAFDLSTIQPEVNVNLPRFLLKDVISDLDTSENGPLGEASGSLAELVRDIKLIRVVVIDANDENRNAVESGVATLKLELSSRWITIVSVPEDNVSVYAISDKSGESMAGIAVLVADGGELVIVNVVGHVPIGKIINIASKMDKIPAELLEKLGAIAEDKPAN